MVDPPAPRAASEAPPTPNGAPRAASENTATPADSLPTVFISYRRSDSSDVSGRIHDRLIETFGLDRVFNDVDSIPLGVDFREHVARILMHTDCLLVVIGPDWVDARDAYGQRRLDAANDPVRVEVEAALARDVPVVPLLVRGASMPTDKDLPASLQALAYRNGMPVRPNPDFHRDMDRLEQQLRALPQRARRH